jgi:hypothetical protein
MMKGKPTTKPPGAAQGTYAEWRQRAAALLERKGISAGVMRLSPSNPCAFPNM